MKKFTKRDYIQLGILIAFFLVLVFVFVGTKRLYGSTVDWDSQHSVFPEYFRSLFYETKQLFPNFSFHLGGGQNIYHFAYYGLLNPIILLSYLLPFIPMVDYIMFSMVMIVIVSIILFYKWLKNHEYNSDVCFLVTFCFLCASPFIFHTHRHIMFVNYIPFLIMGLFGIDAYFDKNRKFLLGLSTFLLVMTSYYYSIGGIFVFIVYGVYRYLQLHDTITVKKFFLDGIQFLVPILLGVLASSVLIIPAFMTILSGRAPGNVSIDFKTLLIPEFNFRFLLYGPYSIGVTAIGLVSLLYTFRKKEKSKLFLACVLLICSLFPIVNYILNGMLYVDAKALIPFLPLVLLLMADFIYDLLEKKVEYRSLFIVMVFVSVLMFLFRDTYTYVFYIDAVLLFSFFVFFYKSQKTHYLYVPILLIGIVSVCIVNFNDKFVWKDKKKADLEQEHRSVVETLLESEDEIYRINSLVSPYENLNRVYGRHYYTTSVYSSLSHLGYNQFYFDTFNNPIIYRTRVITSTNNNLLFNMFIGNKYVVGLKKPSMGYDLVLDGKVKVYENKNVLPIGYVRRNLLSEEAFDRLGYPYQVEALLKHVIVSTGGASSFQSSIQPIKLDMADVEMKNLNLEKLKDRYRIEALDNASLDVSLREAYHDKILLLRFKMLREASCKDGDLFITINGVKNKLTCESWKYHNRNYVFDYVIAEDDLDSLQLRFSKGIFEIGNMEAYLLDYHDILSINRDIDAFHLDSEKTIGDNIVGDIDVLEDGYFTLSIPYDEGFTVFVDGKSQEYEKVNKAFIGFPLSKGKHHIVLSYKAPYKDVSLGMTLFGILGLGFLFFIDRRGRKKGSF